jgi:MFS family permease
MDFSWKEIGMIFAIMLLPFSIITFPLGKYADKMGERKILMFGFAIASLGTLALFFIGQHSIWMWAFWLFITRVGAASIEIMSDTYFFRHIAPENDEYVGVYRSAAPISYILGPLLAFVVFSFVPSFNFIFLVLGMIMLFGVYLSGTIKNQDI